MTVVFLDPNGKRVASIKGMGLEESSDGSSAGEALMRAHQETRRNLMRELRANRELSAFTKPVSSSPEPSQVSSAQRAPAQAPGNALAQTAATVAPRKLKVGTPARLLVLNYALRARSRIMYRACSLSKLLLAELDDVEGLTTLSVDDVGAMLDVEKKKELLGCDNTTCVADIGGALGAELVIYGEVGRSAANMPSMPRSSAHAGMGCAGTSFLVEANEDALTARIPELAALVVEKLNATAH